MRATANRRRDPMAPMTAFYAALLAFLFLALSMNVIRHRYRARTALGDGGDPRLARAIRAQANFAEYVPLTLVLMLGLELTGGPAWLLHLAGVFLLAGRLAHGAAFTCFDQAPKLRVAGMVLTFSAIAGAAIGALAAAAARYLIPQ
jgi:hypothetical protein